ncbi:MAG TPA: hypothetical protein VJN62_10915 [Gemmatimonadales bacterium]|nr:hypothetical protein [Gemmatimonadales bacterium]
MAPDLRYWIGGTLALCLIVAVGAVSGPDVRFSPEDAPHGPPTKWGGQAAALGAQWRGTWKRWRLETYRARLTPAADSARAAGGTAPLLLIDGPSTAAQRGELHRDLGMIWKQAAPEGFKVAVALVIVRDSADRAGPDTPSEDARDGALTYLFPDSLHRDMCLVVVHESSASRRYFQIHDQTTMTIDRWLSESLGPCAFYGAYGIPGREIGRWLNTEGMAYVIYPRWWAKTRDPWLGFFYPSDAPKDRPPSWWWVSMYSFMPWDGAACYGGRVAQCARNVFDSTAVADSQPGYWDEANWNRQQPFFSGVTYLSDLARDLGPARFSAFWSADVPMDSALHLATGKPLGDWTLSWARAVGPTVHLGPSAPPLDVLWGLLPALLAMGASLWYARRRQIG